MPAKKVRSKKAQQSKSQSHLFSLSTESCMGNRHKNKRERELREKSAKIEQKSFPPSRAAGHFSRKTKFCRHTQKSHHCMAGLARLAGLPRACVRVDLIFSQENELIVIYISKLIFPAFWKKRRRRRNCLLASVYFSRTIIFFFFFFFIT